MSNTLGIGLTTNKLVNKRKTLKTKIEKLNNELDKIYNKMITENSNEIKEFLKKNNLTISHEEFVKIKFYIEEKNKFESFPQEIRKLKNKIQNFNLKYLNKFKKNVKKIAILEKKLEIYNQAKDYYIDGSCKNIGWLVDIIIKIKQIDDLIEETSLSKKDIKKIIKEIEKIKVWTYYEDKKPEIINLELKKYIIDLLLKIKSFLVDNKVVCTAKIF